MEHLALLLAAIPGVVAVTLSGLRLCYRGTIDPADVRGGQLASMMTRSTTTTATATAAAITAVRLGADAAGAGSLPSST
jgi:hypothetical protein